MAVDPSPAPVMDHVTGLAPRGRLEALLATALPAGTAVVICDVIGLKQVNECAGFRAGDEVLRRAADRVRVAAPSDLLTARLGGDELLAVFGGPDALPRAEEAAARLREQGQPPLRAAAAPIPEGAAPWPILERLYAALRRC